MINTKIITIRKKLDYLDNKLLKIIKQRTLLVQRVLNNKTRKNQIIDKKRISTILKNIKKKQKIDKKRILTILKNKKKKSIANNVDPQITKKIWKSMISAFIDYEFRNFKKK